MRRRTSGGRFMVEALALAEKSKGKTYPNPAVGAVVVSRGRVVGRGFHRRWGLPHAEVEAIRDAGSRARGGDLYVTLEPCNHYGKTPPCTEAIMRSGVRRVFAAATDPNPMVNGKGFQALRRAGIATEVGIERKAATALNEAYFKFMRQGRPFVTLKIAQTLDGRIATCAGASKWITSPPSRRLVRRMRGEAQAVLVGLNTVFKDDPGLLSVPLRTRDYYRCVLDTSLTTPTERRVVRTARRVPTVIFASVPDPSRAAELEKRGVAVKRVRAASADAVDLDDVLLQLAEMKVMHLLVEGGSAVFTSFLKRGLADRIVLVIAPSIIGDGKNLSAVADLGVERLEDAHGFCIQRLERVGDDVVVTLYPRRK